MKRLRLSLILFFVFLFAIQSARAQSDAPLALVLTADGAVTPAMAEYLERGIQTAEQRGAEVIILQLNTPGGGIDPMLRIVQDMRASRVPVVVYVTPRGAWAASAGTVITLAGHAAAMAPETTIGAASPVGAQGEDLGQTEQAKVTEIMKATVRSLTERRGEQAVRLAEATIELARAVSFSEARQANLVDFVADDLNDLLTQLDGFSVEMPDGPHTLHTAGAATEALPMTLIEQLLQMLTNPNVVFLLLSIGMQAIFIELSSPGGWVAGFIGAVCLALTAYGLGVLTVNWFGLIFLIIAFVLFIIDIKAPTHGALTAAGVGSLIVGALVLFNSPGTPQFQQVSLPLVILTSLITGAVFAIIVGFGLRAQRAPVRTGQESLAGRTGVARTDIAPSGMVQAGSELWSAELAAGSERIRRGDHIEVVAIEGLKLKVRKM
ncbi:MAG: nodulation protein NfeD [Chloroflexi bacterium]|nr:nodulation protein NfeD [Chloroflexota bacterium]